MESIRELIAQKGATRETAETLLEERNVTLLLNPRGVFAAFADAQPNPREFWFHSFLAIFIAMSFADTRQEQYRRANPGDDPDWDDLPESPDAAGMPQEGSLP